MGRELSLAEIFQLGYYWETKILLTAVTLDVFSALDGNARTAAEVAKDLKVDEPALALLLNALVAMRVLTKTAGRYANSGVAQAHLVKRAPGYVGHLLLLQDAEWMHWGRLEDAVRTGRTAVTRDVFRTNPELGANVLAVLDRIGQQGWPVLAKPLGLERARTFLDVGGGAGTNAIAFCRAYPQLRATVFDLPETLRTTKRFVHDAGLEDRITLQAGDFNVDELGGPYDAILMADILHYQDEDANARLVATCFRHLVPGGRLVIKDRFLSEDGTSPAWVTAFAVHILVNTERGRCYTSRDALRWVREAGFESVSEVEPTAIVLGTKGA